MVTKTLFEKLAFPGESLPITESVQRNIQLIFTSQALLDGDNDRMLKAIVPSVIDQSADSGVDLAEYKQRIEQLIKRFEPRVSEVEVETLSYSRMGEGQCALKLSIHNIQVVQEFRF